MYRPYFTALAICWLLPEIMQLVELRLGSSLAILQGGVISFDFGIVYEIFHPDADFLHLDWLEA